MIVEAVIDNSSRPEREHQVHSFF